MFKAAFLDRGRSSRQGLQPRAAYADRLRTKLVGGVNTPFQSLAARLCGFALGALAAHGAAASSGPMVPVAAALIGGCGILLAASARVAVVGTTLIGLGWAAFHIAQVSTGRDVGLPAYVTAEARVLRVAPLIEGVFRVDAEILHADWSPVAGTLTSTKVRLTWENPPTIRPGYCYRLVIRLRPARAAVNASGFDYERWLWHQRISAFGTVEDGRFLRDDAGWLLSVRRSLLETVSDPGLRQPGILGALTVGDTSRIDRGSWQAFVRTGTVHLLVISGLHVGAIGLLGAATGGFTVRLTGLTYRMTARSGAFVGGATAIGGFVLLAGAGLSLLRAATMAIVGLAFVVFGRSATAGSGLVFALAAVLAIDPLAPLAPGFWLSFVAVGVLLVYFAPRPRHRSVRRDPSWRSPRVAGLMDLVQRARLAALRVVGSQILLWLVLAPTVVLHAGIVSLAAPAANLVFVPLVTLLLVPIALLGAALAALGVSAGPLAGADALAQIVIDGVMWFGRLPVLPVALGTASWGFGVAVIIAALLMMLPVGRAAAVATAMCLSVLLAGGDAPVASGQFRLSVLDVGQGTAVVVETAEHVLVYDTGARSRSGFDFGTAVLTPTLRSRGHAYVDRMVLSHADLDHAGGAQAVIRSFPVLRVSAGESVARVASRYCAAGQRWRWDGVTFHVLHPRVAGAASGNASSCVVLVENGQQRVLLAGDIEAVSELRVRVADVDVLLVPHHGSNTSSTRAFVDRVRPRIAIVSAGYDNRFGHPHAAVVERYRDIGAHVVSTAVNGQLTWDSRLPGEIRAGRCKWGYWRKTSGPRDSTLSDAPLPCR